MHRTIPPLALLTAALFLNACAWTPPAPAEAPDADAHRAHADDFRIYGEIPTYDLQRIRHRIRTTAGIDQRILSLRVEGPSQVEVYTGSILPSGAGTGDRIHLRRIEGTWTIVGHSLWEF